MIGLTDAASVSCRYLPPWGSRRTFAGGLRSPPETLGREASWSLANEARVSRGPPSHPPTEVPITPQMYAIGAYPHLILRFDPTAHGVPLSVVRPPLHCTKGLLGDRNLMSHYIRQARTRRCMLVLNPSVARTVHDVASGGEFGCGGDRLFFLSLFFSSSSSSSWFLPLIFLFPLPSP